MPSIWEDKVCDWECASPGQFAGADIVGAGLWVFVFRSPSLRIQTWIAFGSIGVGGGGAVGLSGVSVPTTTDYMGIPLPDLTSIQAASMSYSKLRCIRPFCLEDLHMAWGIVGTVGVTVKFAGVSGTALVALSGLDSLFAVPYSIGYGVGPSGEIAYGGIGIWEVHGRPSSYEPGKADSGEEWHRIGPVQEAVRIHSPNPSRAASKKKKSLQHAKAHVGL